MASLGGVQRVGGGGLLARFASVYNHGYRVLTCVSPQKFHTLTQEKFMGLQMSENTEQTAEQLEELILNRAREIRSERGVSLTDAMILAESELNPTDRPPAYPESFTITIPVRPRVSRWIVQLFGGHPTFTIEERLSAYLVTVLNRARVQSIRLSEAPAEVGKGDAVTLRREHMAKVTE